LERTISHCCGSGDAFALPELLRMKALTLLAFKPEGSAGVTGTMAESLAMSRLQGA
jgi:hypothetical protein